MALKFDEEQEYIGYREQGVLGKNCPYEVIYSYGLPAKYYRFIRTAV